MRLALSLLLVCGSSMSALAAGFPEISAPLRTGRSAAQDAAVIVSVEAYHKSIGSDVPFAHRDGDAMESHLLYTRGVPGDRIARLKGATCKKLRVEVQKAARLVGSEGTLWIYFSGHGSRSEAGHVLVCDDARDDEFFFDTTVPVTALQTTADGSQAKRAIIMIDACFGAIGRDGKTKSERKFGAAAGWVIGSKTVVWSATKGGEQARPLRAAKYGAFTYLAVGALRGWADGEISGQRDGAVTLAEAQAYVKRGLRVVQVAGQTPMTTGPRGVLKWALAAGVKEVAPTLGVAPVAPTDLGEADNEVTAVLRRERCLEQKAKRLKETAASQLKEVRRYVERPGPGSRAVLTAWLQAYQSARVTCGDVERAVIVDDIAMVTAALGAKATTFRPRLVALTGGRFELGSSEGEEGRSRDEGPRRMVEMSAFEMMATEVTQGQYAALMGENPAYYRACGKRCPVENVPWRDAVKYANALSKREALSVCYAIEGESVRWTRRCEGYRLPTEAEWEYAARAGTTGARYGEINAIAWWGDNADKSHPVGQKAANAWGLHDMLGNVGEWCWPQLAYPTDGQREPRRLPMDDSRFRVVRGGSFRSDAGRIRAAARGFVIPGFHQSFPGFRLVRRSRAR